MYQMGQVYFRLIVKDSNTTELLFAPSNFTYNRSFFIIKDLLFSFHIPHNSSRKIGCEHCSRSKCECANNVTVWSASKCSHPQRRILKKRARTLKGKHRAMRSRCRMRTVFLYMVCPPYFPRSPVTNKTRKFG
jgi:hypothetical protein